MLPTKHPTHAAQSTQSNTLQIDIDKANARAKKLLQQSSTRQYLNDRSKLNRSKHMQQRCNKSMCEMTCVSSTQSIPSLRQSRHREQQKERQIRNRLKYIEVEKERNLKTAEWAKRKYSLIVERRTQNLHMRSMIDEGRTIVQKQNRKFVEGMKEKGKVEREHRERNIQRWRSQHRQSASQVKKASEKNQIIINQEKEREVRNKRYMVLNVKREESGLIKKRNQFHNSKKAFANQNHTIKLAQQLQLKRDVLKRNNNLFKQLAEKSKTVKSTYERAQSQLHKLQQVICPRRSLFHSRPSSKNSFFVTKN